MESRTHGKTNTPNKILEIPKLFEGGLSSYSKKPQIHFLFAVCGLRFEIGINFTGIKENLSSEL